MVPKTNTDDGRIEIKRFDAEDAPFDAFDLIEGDRIAPLLVASTLEALGTTRAAGRDAPDTQLAEATITDRYDDVHRAILVDGETGILVRASRTDRQQAMSQKEADWTVREIGTRVSVSDAEIEMDGNDEWDEDSAADGAESWANVVLQDRAQFETDYSDELTISGHSTLTLYEPYGTTKVHASIELEEKDND
jgi:hypothetical protein